MVFYVLFSLLLCFHIGAVQLYLCEFKSTSREVDEVSRKQLLNDVFQAVHGSIVSCTAVERMPRVNII